MLFPQTNRRETLFYSIANENGQFKFKQAKNMDAIVPQRDTIKNDVATVHFDVSWIDWLCVWARDISVYAAWLLLQQNKKHEVLWKSKEKLHKNIVLIKFDSNLLWNDTGVFDKLKELLFWEIFESTLLFFASSTAKAKYSYWDSR